MDELLKNPVFVSHALAAATSVAIGTTLTYPLDTVKTLIQVGATSTKKLSAAQVVGRVTTFSGYQGLYKGVTWLTVGRITSLGARFGVYEIISAYHKDGRSDNYVRTSEALLTGMVAGAVESFVNTPFEMVKLRKQVAAANSSTSVAKDAVSGPVISRFLPRYVLDTVALDCTVSLLSVLSAKHTNMADSLKNYPWMLTGSGKPPGVSDVKQPLDIIKLEGWRAMWRGLRVGISRDIAFGGIFFGSWQFMHLVMLDWTAVGMNPIPETNDDIVLSPLTVSSMAGIAGSLAAAASHGFDTSKARSQCIVLPKYVAIERRLQGWKRPGNWFERHSGVHPSDRKLLFRGISARMARCGLASFLLVGSYFLSVEHLLTKS